MNDKIKFGLLGAATVTSLCLLSKAGEPYALAVTAFEKAYQQSIVERADADNDGMVTNAEENARYALILRQNGITPVERKHWQNVLGMWMEVPIEDANWVTYIRPEHPNGRKPTFPELTKILEQYK